MLIHGVVLWMNVWVRNPFESRWLRQRNRQEASNVIVTFGSVFNIPSIAFGGLMPKSVISDCSSPLHGQRAVRRSS